MKTSLSFLQLTSQTIFALVLLLFFCAANASDAILIVDPEHTLSPIEALQRAQAVKSGNLQPPEFSIRTNGYWWVREFTNHTSETKWVVHAANTANEHVALYLFSDKQIIHQNKVDLLQMAREGKNANTIGYYLPFEIPANASYSIVLRVETPIAHKGLIFVIPEDQARNTAAVHMILIWSATGAMIALMLYNVFLGFGLKSSFYFLYVGHAAGHLIYLLTALGVLGAALPVLERYIIFNSPSIYLGSLFGTMFIYRFMAVNTLSRILDRIFKIFLGFLILVLFTGLLLDPHQYLTIVRYCHLVLAVLVISTAIVGVIHKRPQAIYILIGWGLMIAMTSKGMLGVIGFIELKVEDGIWAFLAILFEMFFMSLALADRFRTMQREKDLAETDNVAKSVFLATMSHEIRTPMNGLLGMVDVLAKTPLSKEQKSYVDTIRYSGSHLLTILNDILDYTRASEGKLKLEIINFDLRELIDNLVMVAKISTDPKGVELQVDIEPELPLQLMGDPTRLRQIFQNFISNAIKFTDQGFIKIGVNHVVIEDNQVSFDFSVTDSGIGIDKKAMNRLFERYNQADKSINRSYGGAGLGLSIVKDLIELMDGDFGVSSEYGKGSQFYVRLTLPMAKQQDDKAIETNGNTNQARNILIVDDDQVSRLVITKLLRSEGHQVKAASSGLEAIHRLRDGGIDLVLMDISMPDMDGLEATREIRKSGISIPIIGLTAHVFSEEHQKCRESGMSMVVTKPVEITKLKEAIAASF